MKTKLYLTTGLFMIMTTCFGQQTSSWTKWSRLMGEWRGEGTMLDNDSIDTKFEMSQDGEKFVTYIEGKSKKIK